VSGRSIDPLADAAWRTAGWVVVDTATIALGDRDAFLEWRANPVIPDEYVLNGKLVFFVTMDDNDYPVETGLIDDDIVGVRVEIVSDVADIPGSWHHVGELVLDSPHCIVVDPRTASIRHVTQRPARPTVRDAELCAQSGVVAGCELELPVGQYWVEVFRSDEHDELGVRLRRMPRSGEGKLNAFGAIPLEK
jgi:hypothetical protein